MKKGFSVKLYPARQRGVNGAVCLFAALFPLTMPWYQAAAQGGLGGPCDPRFRALFTPPTPRVGRYEVCASPRSLPDVLPAGWQVRQTNPLDVFGVAGPYNRSVLPQLYGGQPALVARGFVQDGERLESLTYVSPHPDVELVRLVPGTLIIRFIICCT
jgi:hypothetical protein